VTVEIIIHLVCWAAVVALVVVHLLVERERLPRGGAAFRLAGAAAAASIVAAAVMTRFWPIAALGLLWLRTEVFAHRDEPGAEPSHPWVSLAHTVGRIAQPALAILLRIEIVVMIIVALVLAGQWAKRNGAEFNSKSDRVLCGILNNNC
jgi:hypothetical protein